MLPRIYLNFSVFIHIYTNLLHIYKVHSKLRKKRIYLYRYYYFSVYCASLVTCKFRLPPCRPPTLVRRDGRSFVCIYDSRVIGSIAPADIRITYTSMIDGTRDPHPDCCCTYYAGFLVTQYSSLALQVSPWLVFGFCLLACCCCYIYVSAKSRNLVDRVHFDLTASVHLYSSSLCNSVPI